MAMINMHEAKSKLSDLVARAESGEEIVIARRNKPAVRLVPVAPADRSGTRRAAGFGEEKQVEYDIGGIREAVEAGREFTIMQDGKTVAKVVPAETSPKRRRKPGGLKGMFTLPDSFFDPLPDEEVQAWEGKYSFDPDK